MFPEAATPRRLELHAAYRCANHCSFCSERDAMDRFRAYPAATSELTDLLARMRARGFDHVTFTGGEPTALPRFWEVLGAAKAQGWKTMVISNGTFLSLPLYARRVLPWIDELCLSLHGPDPFVHDGLTGVRGSFARVLRALDNSRGPEGRTTVMVNTVATRDTLAAVPRILPLLAARPWVRHWLLSAVAPEGEASRRYRELAVRHRELAGLLPALAPAAARSGVTLRVFGVPACALGPWASLSNDLYYSPRVTLERVFDELERPSWREVRSNGPTRERVHPAACADCAWRRACGGVFERYFREFGEDGIAPPAAAPPGAAS